MIESFTSLTALAILILAAYGIGRPVVRRLRYEQHDRLAGTVWSLALGLVLAGVALMALGLVGGLYRPLIGILTLAAAFWGIAELRRAWLTDPTPVVFEIGTPPKWLRRGLLTLCSLAALGSMIGALAPATDGDALCYHLELPKLFLEHHSLFCPDYNDHATYPLLVEMWYLWAMTLDGPVAAQLVHWALGILLALSAVLLAELVLGRSWAWLAGAIVLLLPGISNQMTAALNDAALAAFTTLALAALLRSMAEDDGQRWLMAAGLLLGAALSIKYTALLFAAAAAPVWLWHAWRLRPNWRRPVQEGLTLLVLAAAIAGPWYVRAAWHRGNPVYPFFSQHLGKSGPSVLPERKTPLGWNAASLASLPWQVTMHSENFGGRSHQLGPIFLLALPGLLIARRLRGLGTLLTIAALYSLLWYALRQNIRFLYPIAPLLTVAVVWFWMELRRLPAMPRLAAGCVFAGVAALGMIVSLERSLARTAVALGMQTRTEFLLEHEPSYAAALVANGWLKPEHRILSQDYRAFYFDAPLTRETVFRRRTKYDQRLDQPANLAGVLHSAGFTHLLLAESVGAGIRYNGRLTKLVDTAREADPDAYHDLADYEFRDSDGAVRRYRLIEVQPRQ